MKKKIAILIQKSFENKFEPQNLLDTFRKAGWDADLLLVEDMHDLYSQDGPLFIHKTLGDISQYEVLLVREVFKQLKYAINIIEYMKNKGKIVIDNNLAIEKMVINKITDARKLSQEDLPYPRSYHAFSKSDYLELLPQIEKECGWPLVVKHRSLGKGSGIYKVNDRLDLENLLDELEESGKISRYYIQEYLDLKADYRVLYIAGKVVGVMQRFPKKGDFRANFSLGGTVAKAELTPLIENLSYRSAKATNIEFGGIDVVVDKKNNHYILEVNRTPGFKGFTEAYGMNIANLFVEHANNLIS